MIGTALCHELRRQGHRPIGLVRRAPGADQLRWDPTAGTIDAAGFEGIDAVIHLAGAGIGDKRWSDEYRREILDSRVLGTRLLATTLAGLQRPPSVFVSGSAIGFYGNRGNERLDETSTPGSGFLTDVVVAWEAEAIVAAAAGIRTVLARTGIVLSPDGGALRKQLPLFKLGLGGPFSNGRQWQSWISITDEVGALIHLLTADVSGPVNLTAPNPVTNAEFARTLGRVLSRPAVFPVPKFAPKLLLGGDLAQALLFDGQQVFPTVLERSGYEFTHPSLEGCLRTLLGKQRAA